MKSLKSFIYEFNNLCRKDRRIDSWAVYNEKNCVKIDVNFIDYNDDVYDYHQIIDLQELNYIKNIKDFAKYIYEIFQKEFESRIYNGK